MKATLTQDGTLTISPDSEVEAYALTQWSKSKRPKGALVVKTAYEKPVYASITCPPSTGTLYVGTGSPSLLGTHTTSNGTTMASA